MALCPITAAWPSGNIAFVLLHNIYGGCGSIPAHALSFYYVNSNSCNTDVELSSVQFCSAFRHSALSNAEWGHCWVAFQPKWLGKEEFCFWSELIRKILLPISANQNMWGSDKTSTMSKSLNKTGLNMSVMLTQLFKNTSLLYDLHITCTFGPNGGVEQCTNKTKPPLSLCLMWVLSCYFSDSLANLAADLSDKIWLVLLCD